MLCSWCFSQATAAVFFSTSLSLSETYNGNLFFKTTNQEGDIATIISPSVNLEYVGKHMVLSVGYSGSAQFYSNNPDANGYFQGLSIDLDLPILDRQIKGMRVSVIEEMTFSPELPGFSFGGQDEENAERASRRPQNLGQGVQLERTDTFQNQAGLIVSYDWTERLNTTASYVNVITRFSGGNAEDRDAHSTTFNLSYRYPISIRTGWTSTYSTSLTAGGGEGQLIHSAHISVDHRITRLISVDGRVGVSLVKDESVQHGFGAGVSKRFQGGNIDIRYSSGVSTGLGVIRSVTRSETISGGVSRAVVERISSHLRVAYSSTESLSGDEVDAVTTTIGTGLAVRLLEWLSGSLDYSYSKQDSKGEIGAEGEVERNVVSLSLTAVGPSWRVMK